MHRRHDLDEYRKYVEKNGALERRFQTIIVDPPRRGADVEILKGLRDRYEAHHRVQITDGPMKRPWTCPTDTSPAASLPDKAIDVIDEAGARAPQGHDPAAGRDAHRGANRETQIEKDEAVRTGTTSGRRNCATTPISSAKRRRCRPRGARRARRSTASWTRKSSPRSSAKMTGVPLTRLEKEETQRLLELENELHKKVVSQDEAIKAVSRSIRRPRRA